MEKRIRDPIVCGQFYPADREKLQKLIRSFGIVSPKSKIKAKGVILPHAGYLYSGKVATATLSQIQPVSRIILLGTNHTGYGETFSLYASGKWRFPWFDVDIDEELATAILRNCEELKDDSWAHQFEHSLEVQIPLLMNFFDNFKITPIVCMMASTDRLVKLGDKIADIASKFQDVLLIASTDLTHYEPDQEARVKDRLAIEYILKMDPQGLVNTVRKNKISMCGLAPVVVLLGAMRKMNVQKASVTLYQTSGDTSGDYSSVVGYVGVVFN